MPVKHQQESQTQSSQAGGGWEDIKGEDRNLEIWFGWQQKINAGQEGDEGREVVCIALGQEGFSGCDKEGSCDCTQNSNVVVFFFFFLKQTV